MPKSESGHRGAYAALRAALREDRIGRLYVFSGPESYLREHYVAELRRRLLPEGTESFNLDTLEGKDADLPLLWNMAARAPLMAERRLLIVTDFDFTKLSADAASEWAAFFADVPESACLVFQYNLLPFKKDKRNKALAALESHALHVVFETPEESALIAWVARHAASLGKNIANDAARHLIFVTGGALGLMRGEIEKLAAYTTEQSITCKEIDLLTVPVPDAAAFTLGETIAAGRVREAAQTLRVLQSMREPPEMLLGMVAKTIRGLYAARLAKEKRKSAGELRDLMGYRSLYPAEKLMRAAAHRDLSWCRSALRLCLQADGMLKRGQYGDRERVMEWLLASLA